MIPDDTSTKPWLLMANAKDLNKVILGLPFAQFSGSDQSVVVGIEIACRSAKCGEHHYPMLKESHTYQIPETYIEPIQNMSSCCCCLFFCWLEPSNRHRLEHARLEGLMPRATKSHWPIILGHRPQPSNSMHSSYENPSSALAWAVVSSCLSNLRPGFLFKKLKTGLCRQPIQKKTSYYVVCSQWELW